MGHLNGILAWVGGNLNNNFQKSQMPGGGGGMLKLRFDRYISLQWLMKIGFCWHLLVGVVVCVKCMISYLI